MIKALTLGTLAGLAFSLALGVWVTLYGPDMDRWIG